MFVMKIRITRPTIVDGAHCPTDAIVETTDRTARMLIGIRKAAAVVETENEDGEKQYAEPVQAPVKQKRRRK